MVRHRCASSSRPRQQGSCQSRWCRPLPDSLTDGAAPPRRAAGLRDAIDSLRDRLVSDPAFHRVVAALPFARPVATKQTIALFNVVSGFVYAQTLSALVSLDAFALLRERPRSTAELMEAFSMPERSVVTLMRAGESVGLINRRKTGWGLGLSGAAILGQGGVAEMVAHHSRLYADLADPVALLRGERESALGNFWGYAAAARPDAEASDGYSGLMAASQAFIHTAVLHNAAFKSARVLMDLGGGAGAFALAALQQNPNLRAIVADRPDVVPMATAAFTNAGMAKRATAIPFNFFADPIPPEPDIVTLVRILHDHDDAAVATLLANVAQSLGDRPLLIIEPFADPSRPTGFDVYFPWYFNAMGQGRLRTEGELRALLADAGFAKVKRLHSRNKVLARGLTAWTNSN